jgi:hypothetical protein
MWARLRLDMIPGLAVDPLWTSCGLAPEQDFRSGLAVVSRPTGLAPDWDSCGPAVGSLSGLPVDSPPAGLTLWIRCGLARLDSLWTRSLDSPWTRSED